MSCVLRVAGKQFDVDSYLEGTTLPILGAWHKGDQNLSGVDATTSGFNVDVSDAGMDDLNEQIRDALAFMQKYEQEILDLTSRRDVDGATLDFAVAWRDGNASQSDHLPRNLIREVARFGLDIDVSHYWSSPI